MPARPIKSLRFGKAKSKLGRPHREHRSKGKRHNPKPYFGNIIKWREKREKLKLEDLEDS